MHVFIRLLLLSSVTSVVWAGGTDIYNVVIDGDGVHASNSGGAPLSSPSVGAGYSYYATDSDHKSLIVTGGATADFSISGGTTSSSSFLSAVEINGSGSQIDLSNHGSGTLNNTFQSSVLLKNGSVTSLSNSNTGSSVNIMNGPVTVEGDSALYMVATNGTLSNTIDTLNLTEGTVVLGGDGNTTTISTMNWDAGELDFVYANSSFGTTQIDTLNLTGPVTLALTNSSFAYMSSPPGSAVDLFNVNEFNGDQSDIQLVNASPFVEVLASGTAPLGVRVLTDGTVRVNLGATATTTESTTLSAVTGALDNAIMGAIQNSAMQDLQNFSASSKNSSRTRAQLQKSFRKYSRDPFEGFVSALADSNVPILNMGGERSFLTPYAIRVRNSGVGGASPFTEKSYGLLFGSNYDMEGRDVKLTPLIGVGGSTTRYDEKAHSHNRTRTLILGLVGSTKFFDNKVDVLSSLYGLGSTNRQSRQGDPSPSQTYIANAHYETGTLSWQNEAGYLFDLREGFSLRPHAGFQVLANYRAAFAEDDAGSFNQSYHRQTKYFGEGYAGVGLLKKWTSKRYEGKMTLAYQLGREAGDQTSTVMVYTDTTPLGVGITNTKPGLTVQYVNFSGSILDKANNLRVVPGASYTHQHGQYSLAGTIKFEYQW